ncbi:tyrosine-type recombinase/integrase [Frateuria hangzhouensis]|uniref:tyrosine-type recombinase/integrase n=1 Tax=Frateuria hangzhouensis TaxID=2995589 RepID=UPI002260A0E7|nr:site-specific integrase [Frateuria sp. STR12]MCX7514764.1 site-specific integrase [Frateuria sp. STR12]
MATLRMLRSGSWNVQVRIKGESPRSKTFPTRELAEAWATQAESLHKLSKLTEASQWPTVEELGMAYAEAKLKDRESYWKASLMARQLGQVFPLPINQLTPKMVNDFKLSRLKQVKSETCRCQLAFLSRFYRYAIRELLLDVTNPVAGLVMPPASKPNDKVVSRAELDALLGRLKPMMRIIVEIAYETAMRRSEIIKLTPSCLHLEERIADVIDGKTGTRNVPLTHRAVELLREAMERFHLKLLPNDRVFNIKPHSVTNAVKRARERLGLPDSIRLHQLRHTRITNVARKGLNNAQIMVVSGHRDPRSVARYTHLQAKDVLHLID